MTEGMRVTTAIHFRRAKKGRKVMEAGEAPEPESEPGEVGTVPRVSRLMALAIRFDKLIQSGEVADYAELARLGHVSRARVTQIMNFLNLAPDIQEAILYLPRTERGRHPIRERAIRPIATELDWRKQREMWRSIP
jgi:hypothetical protein